MGFNSGFKGLIHFTNVPNLRTLNCGHHLESSICLHVVTSHITIFQIWALKLLILSWDSYCKVCENPLLGHDLSNGHRALSFLRKILGLMWEKISLKYLSFEGKIKIWIQVTGRRGRRRRKLLDDLKERRGRIISFEGESSRSYYVESSLWKRLWTCRKTDY